MYQDCEGEESSDIVEGRDGSVVDVGRSNDTVEAFLCRSLNVLRISAIGEGREAGEVYSC